MKNEIFQLFIIQKWKKKLIVKFIIIFLIVHEEHPDGQKVEHGTTKQICLQCDETIKQYTMKKITLKFCKDSFYSFNKSKYYCFIPL